LRSSEPDADDTVRLVRPRPLSPPPKHARWPWLAVGGGIGVLALGLTGWLLWPRPVPAPPQPPAVASLGASPVASPGVSESRSLPAIPAPSAPIQAAVVPPAPAQSVPAQPPTELALVRPTVPPLSPEPSAPDQSAPLPIGIADEAAIRAYEPTGLTIFRFAANPSIIVLDFASLRQQGEMLNRVAALIEKAATPRDRVLNDVDLAAAIRADGDTVETFYYGHDYSAASLTRFFTLAAQNHILLNPGEKQLYQLLVQLDWLAPDARGGLISVPKAGANAAVTVAARNAILRHELSHGEYFSNPAYAAFVHLFWLHDLTQEERGNVRNFLASERYDTGIEELVENEMQAYLMFTRDPLFFTPARIDMTPERLLALQEMFHRDMPPGWLRDLLGQTLASPAVPY
jgi:hypothetical protein